MRIKKLIVADIIFYTRFPRDRVVFRGLTVGFKLHALGIIQLITVLPGIITETQAACQTQGIRQRISHLPENGFCLTGSERLVVSINGITQCQLLSVTAHIPLTFQKVAANHPHYVRTGR